MKAMLITIQRFLFGFGLLLSLTACDSLSVFAPPPRTSSLLGQPNVTVTEEGKIALDWELRSANSGEFEAYLIELDPNDSTYDFQEGFTLSPPLKYQPITVSYDKSPRNIGTLVGGVKGVSMVLSSQLKNDRKYLLQFVEKKLAVSKKDPTVILLEVMFDTEVPSSASIIGDSLHLTWTPVLGANRYLVYADKEGTILLGESTTNELVIPMPEGKSLTEFYVRPLRGELVAKSSFLVKLNQSAAVVENVTSTKAPGLYTAGERLDFLVDFSKPVGVFGEAYLPLKIGTLTRKADYVSGETTATLTYSYIVQEGDDTEHLESGAILGGDYADVNALSVNGSLPSSEKPASLKSNSAIAIDTTKPTNPLSVGFNSSVSGDGNVALSWGASFDAHLKTYAVKICDDSACSQNCSAEVETLNTLQNLSGLNQGIYYGCVQARDMVNLKSDWIASLIPHAVDKTEPAVVKVSSTLANGAYKSGQLVPITVEFSEPVTVLGGGNIKLKLETGGIDRDAIYASGSGTSTLVFHYTVQSGDISSNLNYESPSALSLGGSGILKDAVGNLANITLPALNDANSLAGQKTLVIDTAAPAAPVIMSPANGGFIISNVTLVSGTSEAGASIQVKKGSTVIGTTVADGSGNWSVTLASALTDGTHAIKAIAKDVALNESPASATSTFTVDASDPLAPVITVLNPTVYKTVPTVSGTAEANTDIILYANGAQIGTTTSDSSGAWSLTPSQPADDDYVLTAKAKDAANRLSLASADVNMSIDNAAPSDPSGLSFNTPLSSSTSIPVNFTESTDAHFKQHNIKLCESTGCNLNCTSVSTALTSPATLLAVNLHDYYACVQGEDVVGNKTAWISTEPDKVQVNSNETTILSVSSPDADGVFKEGESLGIEVEFSRIVTVSSGASLRLLLETGSTDREATYVSGSGSTKLLFTYTVQAGDASQDLNYENVNALSLNGATITDPGLANANLTLPPINDANSLAGTKDLKIDTVAPTSVATVSFAGSYSSSTSFPLTWTASSDANLDHYNVMLCAASDCATSCGSVSTSSGLTLAMSGLNGNSYYGCIQAEDKAAHLSAWVSTATPILVDTVAPVITNVSSSQGNGTYGVGATIPITVEFSKNVVVSSGTLIGITLETGDTDQRAIYSSGSGSNILTFDYLVQSGDTASDLGYFDSSALTLGGGSIKDIAGNDAALTLPAQPGTGSLATNKNIVIDTTAPLAPVITSISGPYLTTIQTTVSGTSEAHAAISLKNSGTEIGTAAADGTGAWTVSLSPALGDGTYSLTAVATDVAGNVSPTSATKTFEVDTSAPNTPVITVHPFPTNDTTPTLSGTSEADMEIRLYKDGVEVATTTADGSGAWSIDASVTAAGSYSWTVKAWDQGGRSSSASTAITGVIDLTGATVVSVNSSTANGAKKLGTVVSIQVNFDEAVNVSGTPTLTLETGTTDAVVNYTSGSGTSSLTFEYTVGAGHTSADLDYVSTSALTGTIKDLAGNAASLTLAAPGATNSLGSNQNISIDGIIPTVLSVTSTNANGAYGATNIIDITVTFSEVVTLGSGTPTISLNTTPTRTASYTGGTGTTVWTFRYTVQTNDFSSNLEYVGGSSITTASTVRDAVGNDADLTLPAIATSDSLGGSKNIEIDGDSPAVTLSVNSATQDGYTDTAITAIDANLSVNGTDTTPAPDSRTMTYACKYDTNANGALDGAGTDCTSLTGLTFDASTGTINWTPSVTDISSYLNYSTFEFQIVGTSSANLSGTTYSVVRVLRRMSTTLGFDAGTESSYTLQGVTMANGKISLNALDQTDDSNDWTENVKYGVGWVGSPYNVYKQGSVNGGSGHSRNLVATGANTYTWLPYASNVAFRSGFETTTGLTHPNWSATDAGEIKTAFHKIENSAMYFDGDAYATTSAAYTQGDFVVNFWVKTAQTYNTSCTGWNSGPALYSGEVMGNVMDWGIHMCNGYVSAGSGNPSTGTGGAELMIKSTIKINNDAWHMITLARQSSTGLMSLYIDGFLNVSGNAIAGSLNAPSALYLGKSETSSTGLVGYIDELIIWNSLIPSSAISQIYERQATQNSGVLLSRIIPTEFASNPWTGITWTTKYPLWKELPDNGVSESTTDYPGVAPNLMTDIRGLWHLNETAAGQVSGSDFADKSGYNAHGTGFGTIAFGQSGRFVRAPYFSGAGQIDLGAPSSLSFGSNSFTVGGWFRTSNSANQRMFMTGMNGGRRGFMIQMSNGLINFGICREGGSTSNCVSIQTTNTYNDGFWHNILAVVDRPNSKIYLYIDGSLAPLSTTNCGVLTSNVLDISSGCNFDANVSMVAIGALSAGSGTGVERWVGSIDEVVAWARALSAAEVLQVFRRGAGRALFQVRSCALSDCTDSTWKGPDGTSTTFFSEQYNNTVQAAATGDVKATPPEITFSNFSLALSNNKYFQYKMILENDDMIGLCNYGAAESCSAEVTSVTALPNHYPSAGLFLYNNILTQFYSLDTLSYTTGPAGCSAGPKTDLAAPSTWKTYSSGSWATTAGTIGEASTTAQINSGLPTFGSVVGRGYLYIMTFLISDGASPCELDAVTITGNNSFN